MVVTRSLLLLATALALLANSTVAQQEVGDEISIDLTHAPEEEMGDEFEDLGPPPPEGYFDCRQFYTKIQVDGEAQKIIK